MNLGADGKAQVPACTTTTSAAPSAAPSSSRRSTTARTRRSSSSPQEFRRVITYASAVATLPTTGEFNGIFPHAVCVQYTGSACAQTATQIANIDPVAKEYIKDIFSKLAASPPPPTASPRSSATSITSSRNSTRSITPSARSSASPRAILRDTIPTTEPQGLFTASPGSRRRHHQHQRARPQLDVPHHLHHHPHLVNEAGFNYSYRRASLSDPVGLINSNHLHRRQNQPALRQSPSRRFPRLAFSRRHVHYRLRPLPRLQPQLQLLRQHDQDHGQPHRQGRLDLQLLSEDRERRLSGNQGSFTFTPASTPTGATTFEQSFANFLLGNVATFAQASQDVTPDIRAQQWELYIQDDWRVKPNLTLNYRRALLHVPPAHRCQKRAHQLRSRALQSAPTPPR